MEYFLEKLRAIGVTFRKSGKPEAVCEVTRKEAYLNYIYKTLSWEDPAVTWSTIIALHFVFWFIVQFQLRLFGIVFLTLLTLFLCDTYFEHKGLKAQRSEMSDAFREIYNLLQQVCVNLKELRKESPPTFCGMMCILFLTVSFIARNVSGYLFAYCVILLVFFGPLLVSKLPEEFVVYIRRLLQNVTNEGLVAESELIPFISAKDFKEADADLESLLTDNTADSLTNSLISGITSMPSHNDVDGIVSTDILEDDFVPHTPITSYTPLDYSSDSDASDYKNLNSEEHFKENSSSEEDSSLSKGLKFPNKLAGASVTAAGISGQAEVVLSALGQIGKKYVEGFFGEKPVRKSDSDSGSEFEFINSDEFEEKS